MRVQFNAALNDSSGYSEASRNYLFALDTLVQKKQIELSAVSQKFELWNTDIGPYKPLVDKYCSVHLKPDVQIIHLTPDCYPKSIIPGIKNIGYMAWETTRLPDKWIAPINALDEVWVPSEWNVQVLKDSGITKPVYAIPHAIDVDSILQRADENNEEFKLSKEKFQFNIPKDKFVFYSIFQWHERKNPIGLLKAYFSEFTNKDQVCLVLKSYLKAHGASEREFIRNEIQRIRQSMFLIDTAPVVFIGGDLSTNQIAHLHKRGDCMVFPTRAEGFSLTSFEAMAFGKPVITTGFSGHLAFMNEQNSYLTKYQLTPCQGMPWGIYTGKMSWAEPDLEHLKKQMRYVFENPAEAKKVGAKAAEDVRQFTWENIGKMMMERLTAVVGGSR